MRKNMHFGIFSPNFFFTYHMPYNCPRNNNTLKKLVWVIWTTMLHCTLLNFFGLMHFSTCFRLLFINLAVPIIAISLFCLCIGQMPKSIPIGYTNQDTGYSSFFFEFNLGQEIIDQMDKQRVVKVIFYFYTNAQ